MTDSPAADGSLGSERRELIQRPRSALDFVHAEFHHAELLDWRCQDLSFAHASFRETLLVKGTFERCNFSDSLLDHSVLVGCTISESLFYAALILGVTFKDCVLQNVDFRRAMFRGCYFEGCQIKGCTFHDGLIFDNDLDLSADTLRASNAFLR